LLLPYLGMGAQTLASEGAPFTVDSSQSSLDAQNLTDWDLKNQQSKITPAPDPTARALQPTVLIIFVIGVFTVFLLWTLSHL